MKQCLPSVNHEQFPKQITHTDNKWLEILDEGDFPPKVLWGQNADLRFTVNNEGEEANKKPRSRKNIAQHSEGNPDNKRQRNRGTGDWNIRGIMIVLHCGKSTFSSLPVSPPIYRSKSGKFQLCTTAQSIIILIFMRTALPY